MFSLVSILAGNLLLLPLLAWASLQDPRLAGPRYHAAVLATLFSTWAFPVVIGAVVLGVATALHAVLLAGRDRHERKETMPWFWVALGLGSAAVFALLLLLVNHLGLVAGEVRPISRWVWR
jgi:hypothetical protein